MYSGTAGGGPAGSHLSGHMFLARSLHGMGEGWNEGKKEGWMGGSIKM